MPLAGRIVLVAGFLCAARASAQYGGRNYGNYDPVIENPAYDGHFTLVRLKYDVAPGGYYYRGEPAWAHGFEKSEANLLKIGNEISLLKTRQQSAVVLAIDDPELFKYPLAYMTEAGYWVITDKEVLALRKYLSRGGMLILDDTRDGFSPGNLGWANIVANFQRIFPGYAFAEVPLSHPIFHSFFDIQSLSNLTQYYDRGRPIISALYEKNDPTRRIMVLVNFNTDISNYWEFSATGFKPVAESNEAYKIGFNYLIYALTH